MALKPILQTRGPLKGSAVISVTATGKSSPDDSGGNAEVLAMVLIDATTGAPYTAGGSGGGGGPATIADGADVAQGTTTDAAYGGTGASTVVALLKGVYSRAAAIATSVAGTLTTTFAALGATGSAAPASASFTGGKDAAGNLRGLRTDANGALIPPAFTGTQITVTEVSLAASTINTLLAANTKRYLAEIQPQGAADVKISVKGATLTSAVAGTGPAGLIIPSGTKPLYTQPVSTLDAITAFTATAMIVVVTEYTLA